MERRSRSPIGGRRGTSASMASGVRTSGIPRWRRAAAPASPVRSEGKRAVMRSDGAVRVPVTTTLTPLPAIAAGGASSSSLSRRATAARSVASTSPGPRMASPSMPPSAVNRAPATARRPALSAHRCRVEPAGDIHLAAARGHGRAGRHVVAGDGHGGAHADRRRRGYGVRAGLRRAKVDHAAGDRQRAHGIASRDRRRGRTRRRRAPAARAPRRERARQVEAARVLDQRELGPADRQRAHVDVPAHELPEREPSRRCVRRAPRVPSGSRSTTSSSVRRLPPKASRSTPTLPATQRSRAAAPTGAAPRCRVGSAGTTSWRRRRARRSPPTHSTTAPDERALAQTSRDQNASPIEMCSAHWVSDRVTRSNPRARSSCRWHGRGPRRWRRRRRPRTASAGSRTAAGAPRRRESVRSASG